MTYFDYPKIGEGYYEERLPDGLREAWLNGDWDYKGVAVGGKSADLHLILLQRGDEGVVLGGIGKQLLRVAMCLSGIAAGTQLDGVDTKTGQDLQCLLQRLLTVEIRKNTQFHNIKPFLSISFVTPV